MNQLLSQATLRCWDRHTNCRCNGDCLYPLTPCTLAFNISQENATFQQNLSPGEHVNLVVPYVSFLWVKSFEKWSRVQNSKRTKKGTFAHTL